MVAVADDHRYDGAERRDEAPQRQVLGVEQPAEHLGLVERGQDPLAIRGEHVGGRHVRVHPAGQHHGEGQRSVEREQPVEPLRREQEPGAGHEQAVEQDDERDGVGRA